MTPRKLVIFTGAGLSADSGIDTFRGSGDNSTWANFDLDVVCNYNTWKKNRAAVHDFYNARRQQLDQVEPNAAHHALIDWQQRYDAILITQNVDDLLERAAMAQGVDANVIHIHGDMRSMHCTACEHRFDIGYRGWGVDEICPACRSTEVKPGVVMFHEMAPLYSDMYGIFGAMTSRDIMVVIGTAGEVVDISNVALLHPGVSILSNLETHPGPEQFWRPHVRDKDFTIVKHGRAAEMVVEIDAVLRGYLDGH